MIRQNRQVLHPGLESVMLRTHYFKVPSLRCLRAHLYWAKRNPTALMQVLLLAITLPGKQLRFHPKSIWATLWAIMVAVDIDEKLIRHVHAHWATFPAHAAMAVSRLTGCTFSFTAHAHDIYANAYGLDKKISEAAFVATISELNREILMRSSVGRGRIEVIRCGVDPKRFPYRKPRPLGDRLRIVAVGTLEEKKGHKYLLEACALLAAQGRKFDCRIIGDGPLREQLQQRVLELGLGASVSLLGARDAHQVALELAEADVFVMPSVIASNKMMEGIPVALMEAMAVGLPVIASRISGIPELVEDNVSGVLVRERDPVGISAAITRLTENSDLRESLGAAARSVVNDNYNLSKNTSKLAELFQSILQRRPPTSLDNAKHA
jgi:colanic acid/amylovoran biosynthesis glycosyltransferase